MFPLLIVDECQGSFYTLQERLKYQEKLKLFIAISDKARKTVRCYVGKHTFLIKLPKQSYKTVEIYKYVSQNFFLPVWFSTWCLVCVSEKFNFVAV